MNPLAVASTFQKTSIKEFSLTNLLSSYPQKSFKKGAYIFREGHSLKYIYFIQQGKVLSLTNYLTAHKELSNGYFLPNQFINLNSLSNQQLKNQAAKALSAVTVTQIPLLAFHTLLRQTPYLSQLIFNALIEQGNSQKTQCHQLILLSSHQRIIHFLLEYVEKSGSRVGYEWVARDFFTQHQIALITNTARQTVSTLLNELRRQRIIHFTKKYLIIRELEALKKLAES